MSKGAEHEKVRKIIEIATSPIHGFAIVNNEVLEFQMVQALREAHAAGRREAIEEMKLKETVAYKCGYDSGRAEAIAEVVPVLADLMQTATWFFEGPYDASPPEDTLPRARALLEKLNDLP